MYRGISKVLVLAAWPIWIAVAVAVPILLSRGVIAIPVVPSFVSAVVSILSFLVWRQWRIVSRFQPLRMVYGATRSRPSFGINRWAFAVDGVAWSLTITRAHGACEIKLTCQIAAPFKV